MELNNGTGGWKPFIHDDKPHIPGQDSNSIFTKEGLILFAVITVLLVVGGFICEHFFGPHPLP